MSASSLRWRCVACALEGWDLGRLGVRVQGQERKCCALCTEGTHHARLRACAPLAVQIMIDMKNNYMPLPPSPPECWPSHILPHPAHPPMQLSTHPCNQAPTHATKHPPMQLSTHPCNQAPTHATEHHCLRPFQAYARTCRCQACPSLEPVKPAVGLNASSCRLQCMNHDHWNDSHQAQAVHVVLLSLADLDPLWAALPQCTRKKAQAVHVVLLSLADLDPLWAASPQCTSGACVRGGLTKCARCIDAAVW